MFAAEDDPETEERGIEDALLDIFKQQHPRPLRGQREKLQRHVQERHGDSQSENHPVKEKHTPRWLDAPKRHKTVLQAEY